MAQVTVNIPDPPQAQQGGAAPQRAPINWQNVFERLAPVIVQIVSDVIGGALAAQNAPAQQQPQGQQQQPQGQQPQSRR